MGSIALIWKHFKWRMLFARNVNSTINFAMIIIRITEVAVSVFYSCLEENCIIFKTV